MRNANDLASPLKVIDVARLYFEEGESVCAHELLEMAIEVSPLHTPLRLAQIEIAFLGRDGPCLLRAARVITSITGRGPIRPTGSAHHGTSPATSARPISTTR